jgi:hypothetical protein
MIKVNCELSDEAFATIVDALDRHARRREAWRRIELKPTRYHTPNPEKAAALGVRADEAARDFVALSGQAFIYERARK